MSVFFSTTIFTKKGVNPALFLGGGVFHSLQKTAILPKNNNPEDTSNNKLFFHIFSQNQGMLKFIKLCVITLPAGPLKCIPSKNLPHKVIISILVEFRLVDWWKPMISSILL